MKFKKVLIAGALALGLAACSDDDKASDATPEEAVSQEEMQAKLAEQQVENNKVVAVVNDEELVGEQYNAILSSIQSQLQQMGQDPTSKEVVENIKAQTLDTIVNQALILQKAKETDITATEAEIDESYATLAESFGDEETMKEALEKESMEVETIREKLAESIVFQKYQDQVIPIEEVTDTEIEEYYDLLAAQAKESEQELPPLEDVSEEIKRIIEQEEQQKQLGTHVEALRADAKIELKI